MWDCIRGGRMKPQRVFIPSYAIATAVACLSFFAAPSALRAQQFNNRNIATFTAAQAAQGKTAYAKSCASCHGQSLSGGESAGALNGNSFSQNWGGKSADTLFTYINTKMPPANPGELGPETNAQIVAYILQVNGVQAGDKDFPSDVTTLAAMTIPRGATLRSAPMMPLSPLAPPMPPVVLPNPLEK